MKFLRKPFLVEARQLTDENIDGTTEWINTTSRFGTRAERIWLSGSARGIRITDIENKITVRILDWIIRETPGKFYACKPDIFEQTYEPI